MNKRSEPPLWRFFKFNPNFAWKQSKRIRFIIYAIIGIAFYLLLFRDALPIQYDLEEGSISKITILSPVTKIDKYSTQIYRQEARKKVEPQYRKDEEPINAQIEQIDRFFTETHKIMNNATLDENTKKSHLQKLNYPDLPDVFYEKLLRTPIDQIQELRLVTREMALKILNNGVKREEIKQKKEQVDTLKSRLSLGKDSLFIAHELSKASIVQTEFYDSEATEELRKVATNRIKPVVIRKGQLIVAKNDVITIDQYNKLKELGFVNDSASWSVYLGLGLIIVFMMIIAYYYIEQFHPQVHQDHTQLLMLCLVFLLTISGMKVVANGQNLEWNTIGYLAPTAFGVMLITILLDTRLAFGSAVVFAIFASVIFNVDNAYLFDFRYGLVSLVSGIASSFAISGIHKRSKILLAGLVASASTLPVITALFFLVTTESTNWKTLFTSLLFGLASGLFSAVLTIGFLSYFEMLFGILSPMRLLELANPNHPLLRKLLIEAPGTYHHSIIVGNLSESAAESINADGLLARVGAYYHDIGKTKRPQFFIENQLYQDNPHDRIAPNLSKSVIISHPRDGVEMLREHKIPTPIQDIAAQHHGTTLLKYFYFKALKLNEGTQILEEDYRYPGPKAQTKEAAIVGICDCVEAAVRSISRPTPARIENMVRKIIQDRLEDGQFNECDLTLKELESIRQAICETLKGLFHSRIEYPDDVVPKGVK